MSESIADRIARVQERIQRACALAGRARDEVRLIAVSKNHPPESVTEAAASGLRLFGENRVQEAKAKIPSCPGNLEWHLVGHLQSNKVKPAVQLFSTIHSIDSISLLAEVDAHCGKEGLHRQVFLEVNVSGEGTKFGMKPETVEAALEAATRLTRVDVVGLMSMPPFTPDPEGARPHFKRLRELRDQLRSATGFSLDELSMGMSHDFEVAIGEGATIIRVGTDIFGKRTESEE
jgi:pyridoxal phosphate enzyme (YggS family)